MERVPALKLAGSGDRQDPFGETLSVFGLVSEAKLSPLDGRSDCLLSRVACGFYSLMGKEGE